MAKLWYGRARKKSNPSPADSAASKPASRSPAEATPTTTRTRSNASLVLGTLSPKGSRIRAATNGARGPVGRRPDSAPLRRQCPQHERRVAPGPGGGGGRLGRRPAGRLARRTVGRAGVRLLPGPAVPELGHRLRCGSSNGPAPPGGGRRGHRDRLQGTGATGDG